MPTDATNGYALPDTLDALLDECDITYFQSSGPGGQHKNRTRTAVRLLHRPTGIMVIAKRQRSQRQNRKDALERLRGRLSVLLQRPPTRVATRPSEAARGRRLEEKRKRAQVKRLRGPVDSED